MSFEWDDAKNRENLRKHDIRFETAALVFEDPYAITQHDSTNDEHEVRLVTLGLIGPGAVLFVVHTWRVRNGAESIRIISARAATARERKFYEDANKRSKKRHRSDRG